MDENQLAKEDFGKFIAIHDLLERFISDYCRHRGWSSSSWENEFEKDGEDKIKFTIVHHFYCGCCPNTYSHVSFSLDDIFDYLDDSWSFWKKLKEKEEKEEQERKKKEAKKKAEEKKQKTEKAKELRKQQFEELKKEFEE